MAASASWHFRSNSKLKTAWLQGLSEAEKWALTAYNGVSAAAIEMGKDHLFKRASSNGVVTIIAFTGVQSFFAILALFFMIAPCQAKITEGGMGMCYGKDNAYLLTAPKGWMLDTESGVDQGLYAVFYPKGSDWNGPVAMYTNTAPRDGRTAERVLEKDAEYMRKSNPNLKVESGGTLPTADGKEALVQYFSGDSHGNTEAVGYVLEKNVVVNIVLTARRRKDYDSALPAFQQLVGSYKFVGDGPNKLEKKPELSQSRKPETRGTLLSSSPISLR